MATLPLPQVSPQGGPNPNSPFGGLTDPTASLPSMGGVAPPPAQGGVTMDGIAQATAMANLRSQMAAQTAPDGGPLAGSRLGALFSPATGAPSPDAVAQYDAARSAASPGGVMGAIGSYMFGTPEERAAHAQRVQATDIMNSPQFESTAQGSPSIMQELQTNPVGAAIKIGPMIEAAVQAQKGGAVPGPISVPTPTGPKMMTDPDPAATAAAAKAHGVPPHVAYAMANPHHLSEDEFVHAMQGTNMYQLQQMWEMQHYLNPQQQAAAGALSVAQQQAQPGAKPMNAAQTRLYDLMRVIGGAVVPLPETAH